MLTSLDPQTGLLPSGVHDTTLAELKDRFGGSYGRKKLLGALDLIVTDLWSRNVTKIWIGGSFVTSKVRPRDIDLIFDPGSSDTSGWGLLDFDRHEELKRSMGIDLWPFPSPQRSPHRAGQTISILEYFQTTRDLKRRGVVRLLREEPAE